MKIAFICSSLEVEKDGIGDYCRTIGSHLQQVGHQASYYSFNDAFISKVEKQGDVTRFPSNTSIQERWKEIKNTIIANNETPFFQYSPFAFSPKGIPSLREINLISQLENLSVMVHETWVGAETAPSLKHYLLGQYQKQILKRLILKSRVNHVFTSNQTYRSFLDSIRVESSLLPLPGNIEVLPTSEGSELIRKNFPILTENLNEYTNIVVFGAIHEEWDPSDLIRDLLLIKHRGKLRIISCGRSGGNMKIWRKIENEFSNRLDLLHLGPQPSKTISAILHFCDIGISTNPWKLVGKSGTTAAMLEHGLPVIVCRDDYQCRYVQNPNLIDDKQLHKHASGNSSQLEAFLNRNQMRSIPRPRVKEISDELIRELG